MKNGTEDIVYRCKDCSKYNLCQYYYRRKETSQICHYFESQERKTGKWIDGHSTCSICYWYSTNRYGLVVRVNHNYCPNCGAKMEVDE